MKILIALIFIIFLFQSLQACAQCAPSIAEAGNPEWLQADDGHLAAGGPSKKDAESCVLKGSSKATKTAR